MACTWHPLTTLLGDSSRGGYVEVYFDNLEDGKFLAIKRLTRGSKEEMTTNFLSELGIIVHVDHPILLDMIELKGDVSISLVVSPWQPYFTSILYGMLTI